MSSGFDGGFQDSDGRIGGKDWLLKGRIVQRPGPRRAERKPWIRVSLVEGSVGCFGQKFTERTRENAGFWPSGGSGVSGGSEIMRRGRID